jgi:hypothetical protein
LNDRLRTLLLQTDPILTPAHWRETDGATMYEIYLEMLDDDEPEQRQAAYKALRESPSRPRDLRERLKLQRYDPATADLAPPLPEYAP